MLDNNLFVNLELRLSHFEDAWSAKRGYEYQEERFERSHTKSVWTRIQHFLSPLIEVLRVPRPSFGRVDCALSMVEC